MTDKERILIQIVAMTAFAISRPRMINSSTQYNNRAR